MRYLIPLCLILSGCTTTRIECAKGDVPVRYSTNRTEYRNGCVVLVKKNGLIQKTQVEAIKNILDR